MGVSYEPVPDGELAAVVTFLEMREPPAAPVPASDADAPPNRTTRPSDEYRALFRLVGAPWLWFSRLVMPDAKLEAIIHDPAVELYAVEDGGDAASACSSSISAKRGECELAFIGLVPELAGKGHGRWLLAEALRLAWRDGVSGSTSTPARSTIRPR